MSTTSYFTSMEGAVEAAQDLAGVGCIEHEGNCFGDSDGWRFTVEEVPDAEGLWKIAVHDEEGHRMSDWGTP